MEAEHDEVPEGDHGRRGEEPVPLRVGGEPEQPGRGEQVKENRQGGAGPADGGARWWAYLWRAALGAVVLAGLVGYRRVTRYFRERRHPVQQDDGDDMAPVRVRVSARQHLDRMAVAVSDPEARPVWQVRITTQEPDLDPVIIEEKP